MTAKLTAHPANGKKTPFFLLVFSLLLIIVILWLPTGWTTGLTSDAYFFFLNAENNGNFGIPSRPFLPLIYLVGSALIPDSFANVNVVLAALLFLRSLAAYIFCRQLGLPVIVSFSAALLLMVWASDTGVFYLGALTVYSAGTSALFAIICFLHYSSKGHNRLVLLLMWLMQIVTLLSYEANIFLIVLTPLLLPNSTQYQTSLFTGFNPLDVFQRTFNVYLQNLTPVWIADYWGNSGQSLIAAFLTSTLLLAVLALVSGIDAKSEAQNRIQLQSIVRASLLGLIIIFLSIVMFLPTNVLDDNLRVYWISSLGGTLTLSCAFWLLTSRLVFLGLEKRVSLYILIVGVLLFAGVYTLQQQHIVYANRSEAQQQLVLEFAQVFPDFAPATSIVVFDESPGAVLNQLMDSPWHFPFPFYVAYDNVDSAFRMQMCQLSAVVYELDTNLKPESTFCYFSEDRIAIVNSGIVQIDTQGSQLLMVRYTGDQFAVVTNPRDFLGFDIAGYDPADRGC